ncbi:hypothetical protein GDO86_007856 [Hymenochirus boettgeri]|uniref:Spermatogenesis associated 6 n=1 Tax=Hymenochirus boettgeri TaxID=247094 RepID=A0A8T2IYA1_9PIPI|nr:hypothetical protein GDO86_007856 [Hymenochirus boettgeri]
MQTQTLFTHDQKNDSCRISRNYERPTIASKSRSPSPYTKRRMCELSQDARQRLAHLNLGPHEFKKETEKKPPFVIRHVDPVNETVLTSYTLKGSDDVQECSRLYSDNSLIGSFRPSDSKIAKHQRMCDLSGSFDSLNDHLFLRPAEQVFNSTRISMSRSAPLSTPKHPPSPILNRSSLRERFHSDSGTSANLDEIHRRVKNMLRTHSARQQSNFDKTVSWQDEPLRWNLKCNDPLRVSELQHCNAYLGEKSIHLDNGEFWSNSAAVYRGKCHRTIFEESLDKIYKNMYKKASERNVFRNFQNF